MVGKQNLPEISARSDELDKCVNCGLCQSVCPTYLEEGHEGKTARGKIAIMKKLLSGEIAPTRSISDLADDCVTCYACRTICPAGVETDRLWTAMRQDLGKLASSYRKKSQVLRWTVGSPSLLKRVVRRFGQIEGFDRKYPGNAKLTNYGLPLFKGAPYLQQMQEIYPAIGKQVGRIGFLIGCSGNFSAPWAVDSAITLLRQCGWEVVVPINQGCCGAPAINNGQWKLAKKLAQTNLRIFDSLDIQAITSADATCTAAMAEDYSNLFLGTDEAEFSVERVAAKTVELSILAGRALDEGRLQFNPLKVSVTVHDSCHSTHFGKRNRWRDLLKAIPGIDLREMAESDVCCGFGGSYAVMHRSTSDKIAARKMANAKATGAEIVVVGSPGCQIRMQTQDSSEEARPQVRVASELIAGMAI